MTLYTGVRIERGRISLMPNGEEPLRLGTGEATVIDQCADELSA